MQHQYLLKNINQIILICSIKINLTNLLMRVQLICKNLDEIFKNFSKGHKVQLKK